MSNSNTNYNTKIDNPKDDGLVTSAMFYVKSSDIFDSVVVKSINVRRKGQIDYETIFEQKINKKYSKQNNKINITEEEVVITLKELSQEEVSSILGFISYNKRALDIFKDYLSKTKYNYLQEDEYKADSDIKECMFNFEEYNDKKEDEKNKTGISGFLSSQIKKDNKIDKVIQVKINKEWKTIYYCTYYKQDDYIIIDSEMCRNISGNSINLILEYIKYNKRLLEDFNLYLERTRPVLETTKQY